MEIRFNRDNDMADVIVDIKPTMEASITRDAVKAGVDPKIFLTNFALAILVVAVDKLKRDTPGIGVLEY